VPIDIIRVPSLRGRSSIIRQDSRYAKYFVVIARDFHHGLLEALAEATGGETFFPRELSEVERIAHKVAHDIRDQYTIVYSPSNPSMDGSFRQIKVAVNAPGKPTVRHRSGYYATPDLAGVTDTRSSSIR
jgi:VWFA-related protein